MTTTRWLVIGVAGAALALGGVLGAATCPAGTPTAATNGIIRVGNPVPNPPDPPVIRG